MSGNGREIEVKFCVQNRRDIERRLLELGARLVQPRCLEVNLRFDTSNHDLERQGRVLRLRQDNEAHLTFKGDSQLIDGALSRKEIEFTVGDFETARQLIEALGYEVVFLYEKYRTTYEIGVTQIMLDELPYGSFVEVEGELESLRSIAADVGLDWEAAIPDSYHVLFKQGAKKRNLKFHDLSFKNFRGLEISPEDLEIDFADRPHKSA